jgi:hypothetical protein
MDGLTPTERKDELLTKLYNRAIVELGLCSEVSATFLAFTGPAYIKRPPPRDRSVAPVGYNRRIGEEYERRWRDPEEDRYEVLADLLKELARIRYSPKVRPDLYTALTEEKYSEQPHGPKWKQEVEQAPGSLRKVAARSNCHHETVRRLRQGG